LSQASEGSDAESKYDWKWRGVPPWEIQHVCTNELIGQDLSKTKLWEGALDHNVTTGSEPTQHSDAEKGERT